MLLISVTAGTAAIIWFIYAIIPTCYYRYIYHKSLENTLAERSLLLSFDDGPDERYTPQLLHILAEHQVKAIFFLPAFKAKMHPQLVQQIIQQGHQIGFHGYLHCNPWGMGFFRTAKDFRQGLAALQELGIKPYWYRPPHGTITLGNLLFVKRTGLHPMLWTVLVGDWRNIGGDEVLSRLWDKVTLREIICLHDSGEGTGGEEGAPRGTLAAIERFIPQALAEGYHFIELRNGITHENAD